MERQMTIDEITMLCDKDYADEQETREIDGIDYTVIEWEKVGTQRMTDELIDQLVENFRMDETKEVIPKIFFVIDCKRKLFFFGSWDAEEHKPYSTDPDNEWNMNMSEFFKVMYPEKQSVNAT